MTASRSSRLLRSPRPGAAQETRPDRRTVIGSETSPTTTALRTALTVVGAFGPPLTVATALLVYFGWARSYVEARELGIDESVLGMSTRDYLLRSINTLYVPLLLAAAVGVCWLLAHERLLASLENHGRAGARATRQVFGALRASWLAVPLLGGVAGLIWPGARDLIVPLSFTLGILLATYSVAMVRRIDELAGNGNGALPRSLAAWHAPLMKALIGALVTLSLFWELANFAGVVGRGLAHDVVAGLPQRTGVVVYSNKDLQIEGPGVSKVWFSQDDSAYRYRYDGLRILQESGGKFYLMPVDWSLPDNKIIVLPDDGTVRLEFTR